MERTSRHLSIAAALIAAMAIGAWLRWSLAGVVELSLPFSHLRHAHSHLGYFGLLFPLAWLGWDAAGARTLGRTAWWIYGVATVVACVGFVRSGYGIIAIVGSTIVGGYWLWSAIALLPRMKRLRDPLGGVPIGVVASLACVPPIAMTLRSDPALAHGFVATFLSGLLLLVVVPSALASQRISPGPWPAFLLTGSLGALFLGVAPNVVTRGALLAYAGLLAIPAALPRLATHLRVVWGAVAFGLAAMALGAVPNVRPVALGATHFLILGPVLATLSLVWLPRTPPAWAWWVGHACWGGMSAALVLQAFTSASWTWAAAAAGGTGTLVWWAVVLAYQRNGEPDERSDRQSGPPNPRDETSASPSSSR
ncbi:MAG: hypothetical protein AAGE52_16415 [Myxococcota bacterium]